jgi:hypothetical protein
MRLGLGQQATTPCAGHAVLYRHLASPLPRDSAGRGGRRVGGWACRSARSACVQWLSGGCGRAARRGAGCSAAPAQHQRPLTDAWRLLSLSFTVRVAKSETVSAAGWLAPSVAGVAPRSGGSTPVVALEGAGHRQKQLWRRAVASLGATPGQEPPLPATPSPPPAPAAPLPAAPQPAAPTTGNHRGSG